MSIAEGETLSSRSTFISFVAGGAAIALTLVVLSAVGEWFLGEDAATPLDALPRIRTAPDPDRRAQPPQQPQPQPKPAGLRVLSIKTKVTLSNEIYAQYSYILEVKNGATRTIRGQFILQWLDADGFVVYEVLSDRAAVNALQVHTFRGAVLIPQPSAETVTRIVAKAI